MSHAKERIQQIDAEHKVAQAKIAEADRGLQEAKEKYDHHPWHWGQRRQVLLQVRQVWEGKIVALDFERRGLLPAAGSDTEWRPATSGFVGSDH